MMIELFATIILLGSLAGIAIITLRKIPVLRALSPKESKSFSLSFNFNIPLFENFPQKFLRKIKILTLKTENKISDAIEHLEKNNKTYKNKFKENYWEGLQNSADSSQKIKVSEDENVEENLGKSVKKSLPR